MMRPVDLILDYLESASESTEALGLLLVLCSRGGIRAEAFKVMAQRAAHISGQFEELKKELVNATQ